MSVAVSVDESDAAVDQQGVVFRLGTDEYCMNIEYVDEIVERDTLTPLPNSAPHFEGVMDLRGQTTTIFNPQSYFDVTPTGADDRSDPDRILILDNADANVGWLVDGVDRVIEYGSAEVETKVQEGAVEGVLRRDEGFIIMVNPTTVVE